MQTTSRSSAAPAGLAAMALSAAMLAACTGGPPGGVTGGPTARAGASTSGECRSMKRSLDQMNARGDNQGQEYRDLLDTYLKRCFDRDRATSGGQGQRSAARQN